MSSTEVEPTGDKVESKVEPKLEEEAEVISGEKTKQKPEDVAKGQRVVPYSQFVKSKRKSKVREGQYEV